jgi:hypothetical protein
MVSASELVLRVTIPRTIENVKFSRWKLMKDGKRFDVNPRHFLVEKELLLSEPESFLNLEGLTWEPDSEFNDYTCKSNRCTPGCRSLPAAAGSVTSLEFSVCNPPLGTRYMVSWTLPVRSKNYWTKKIINDVAIQRTELLELKSQHVFHGRLKQLDAKLRSRYWDKTGTFEVNLFTYDESDRRAKVVDGFTNGKELTQDNGAPFWLYFGFGLAGAALRRGDLFVYVRLPAKEPGLDFYLPLSGLNHERFSLRFR